MRPIASLGANDVDISDWLGPTDQMPASPPPAEPPPAESPATSETMAGKSFEDTAAVPFPKPEEEKKPATKVGRQAAAGREALDREQRAGRGRHAPAVLPSQETLRARESRQRRSQVRCAPGAGVRQRRRPHSADPREEFLLLGGSQETHGVMQETAVKINERLESAASDWRMSLRASSARSAATWSSPSGRRATENSPAGRHRFS